MLLVNNSTLSNLSSIKVKFPDEFQVIVHRMILTAELAFDDDSDEIVWRAEGRARLDIPLVYGYISLWYIPSNPTPNSNQSLTHTVISLPNATHHPLNSPKTTHIHSPSKLVSSHSTHNHPLYK